MNVLVTGASRGIGRATARLAGTKGWNVGVNYNSDETSAQSTVQDVKAAGGNAITLKGDVSTERDVFRIFDLMQNSFGRLDGVVINAGITAQAMSLAKMEYGRLKRMFDVNVLGAYLTAREAARRMPEPERGDGGGSIVIVSSAASKLGSPNEYVDYAGTKGAMDSLTLGLSKELGPLGVRVNAVRPGLIKTDIHKSSGDVDRADRLGNQTPLGRAGEAEEVAEAIVWMLSPASSYVSGALLDVSGGR